jgi:hypothetical protein
MKLHHKFSRMYQKCLQYDIFNPMLLNRKELSNTLKIEQDILMIIFILV